MKEAEIELENILYEEITVTDMKKGRFYIGPIIVNGFNDRSEMPFSFQTNEDLDGFDYLDTYYLKLINNDAKNDLKEVVESVCNEETSYSVSIATGEVDFISEHMSYNDLKSTYGNNLIYNLYINKSDLIINDQQVPIESAHLFELINEFQNRKKKLQEIEIDYRNLSLRFSRLLYLSKNVTLECIEDAFEHEIELERKYTK